MFNSGANEVTTKFGFFPLHLWPNE